MKIAIPVLEKNGLNSKISEHFGHSPYFALLEVDDEIRSIDIVENPYEEHGPGVMPNFLKSLGVDVVIVRGMGKRAVDFFEQLGIEVIRGASGSVESIVKEYISGSLKDMEYHVDEKYRRI